MSEMISISEAKSQFSEYVSRAASSKETFVIERRGRPLAALVSVADLRLLETLKAAGPEAGLLGAVGSWPAYEAELEPHILAAVSTRHRDKPRPVSLD